MTPYERVRLSRERTAATFPLPSVLDCIRYAITELAEYDDALLRQERTNDKRNNDKAHDARSELGQCGYMLLSALLQLPGPFYCGTKYNRDGVLHGTYYFALLHGLTRAATHAMYPASMGDAVSYLHQSWGELVRLADVHGWPVDALIDDACAAFERKHATPAREAR